LGNIPHLFKIYLYFINTGSQCQVFSALFCIFLVGRDGVEPSQSQTADLQSVGLATCSASPYVEGEESNLTPTIHPQVNLVPHIFHKGHIHGFALPLSSTSTLIFSHCVIILYHTLGVNVKCLMQIFAFYTKNLLRGEVSSII